MPPKTQGEASSSEPSHSRNSSNASARHNTHAPTTPTRLRTVQVPSEGSASPDETMHRPSFYDDTAQASSSSQHHDLEFSTDGIHPAYDQTSAYSNNENVPPRHQGAISEGISEVDMEPTARTRLLSHQNRDATAGHGSTDCNQGTHSPRPWLHRRYGSFNSQIEFDARFTGGLRSPVGEPADETHALLGDAVADGVLGGAGGQKMSTTTFLAKEHGIKNHRLMYLAYYIPILSWAPQYKWRYLKGDLAAAVTMASFYIPMALSYASNLAHLPPVNGLYSFAINPLIYGILGSCPMMIVGPEAPGSLLTGEVVRENIKKGTTGDQDGRLNAEIAGIVTCLAGAFIFVAGLFRLGFLDNVLSRPFLRGFISAIGIVIFIDQLIPEMGLARLAADQVSHGSCLDKVIFLIRNIGNAHGLTTAVSFGAFAIIMFFRELKKRLQPRYPSVAYIPDRFVVVVLSALFAWWFRWDEQGLAILGEVKPSGPIFAVHFPFDTSHLKYASDAINTALIIALLGFFESSVAAKSLGSGDRSKDGVHVSLSANRELIALGTANITGGLFMALPAFGGYGRSKVNASTGGLTPMSSIFLSIITILCTCFLLPYFYYLPKGVLCSMVSVVAYSLVEEAPHDIKFFWRIRGWSELALMFIIFLVTILWDLKRGIGVGIALSILRLIKHATRPRIQILGRVPGTSDKFANAELDPGSLEFVEGFLIVKIPEPLTFANTGSLRNRLRRLEDHGTSAAHPALPRVRREENNKNIVFDVHGVTSLDGAGTQVLYEIVESYRKRDVKVFFCRVPNERSAVWELFESSGIVELCGGRRHFVKSVEEALRMTELERMSEEFGYEAGSSRAGSSSGVQ
ncbi:sulfate transporter family-domain-containing protein [Massariosphaeria phaeospora]|uniref:Sulfate transporter family-domain-containing protein n=1 Tax=Massariosphaeria phaeospora TaxID=100035 RepID=A0A7C8M7C6_9PLEO|nr:sulfate transporter family-domain-containing protein [Massariosphaeria phaeospora]